MSLKEIQERHEAVNQIIVAMARQNGKTMLTQANQDRGVLLKLVDEVKERLEIFQQGNDFIEIRDILNKLNQ